MKTLKYINKSALTLISIMLFGISVVNPVFAVSPEPVITPAPTQVETKIEVSNPDIMILYTTKGCTYCEEVVQIAKDKNNGILIKDTAELEVQKEIVALCKKDEIKKECGFIPLLVVVKDNKYYATNGRTSIKDYLTKNDVKDQPLVNEVSHKNDFNTYTLMGIVFLGIGLFVSVATIVVTYRNKVKGIV